jgi:TPR repeat protein
MKLILLLTALLSSGAFASEFDDTMKLAQEGDANAQFELGRMFFEGSDGATKSDELSREWLKKSADWYIANESQLDAEELKRLADLYRLGYGIPKDINKAVPIYIRLAEQGDPNSQKQLAHLYEIGNGVEKNGDEAFKWYAKAARHGDWQSAWKLGDIYSEGLWLNPNPYESEVIPGFTNASPVSEALHLAPKIQSFAKKGGSLGPLDILQGLALARDTKKIFDDDFHCLSSNPDYYIKAYMWYEISVLKAPKKKSESKIKLLASVMSKEQIAKASSLASVCLESDFKECEAVQNGATNKSHSFRSNLFDKPTKWKMSECKKGGKLRKKYLSADDGHIEQEFTEDGQLAFEISSTEKVSAQQWFYPSGKLRGEFLYAKIPEEIILKLRKNPKLPFEKVSATSYYKNGKMAAKSTYSPVKAPKTGRRKNELEQYPVLTEFYDENGQLTKKMFYKERSKRFLKEEFYNEDGTIRRTKKYK